MNDETKQPESKQPETKQPDAKNAGEKPEVKQAAKAPAKQPTLKEDTALRIVGASGFIVRGKTRTKGQTVTPADIGGVDRAAKFIERGALAR